jgi:molybdopterin-guanine dinucleotide biosynthesis protein
MTITLPLKPQEEASLIATAQAKGLTVDAFVREELDRILVGKQPAGDRPLQTAADIVLEWMSDAPAEDMAKMPRDGASQHDHYIYGWPKREV